MNEAESTTGTEIAPEQLPTVVSSYLTAHRDRELETAIAAFTPDAEVADDGQTCRGAGEIRTWLGRAASEYTFTTQLTGATRISDTHYDVVQHLEGDFPGGVVDLHYRFVLRDGLIARLTIEP